MRLTSTLGGWIREARDRAISSDPGLNRLRTAGSAVIAVATTLGVEFAYGRLVGAGPKGTLIGILVGAIVALLGSMALSGTSLRDKAITALCFPVAMGVGMTAGAAIGRHQAMLLTVFVVIMFAAVYVRRFGMRFFFLGFLGWIGYFLVSRLNLSLAGVPTLLINIAIATAWVLLLSVTALRPRPDRTLRRTLSAFRVRSRAVADASAELLENGDSERRRRRLHSQQVRLTEAALMIEGQLDDRSALPKGWPAPTLRQWLIDAQLAIDGLAMTSAALAAAGGEHVPAGARTARRLADGDIDGAEREARTLGDAACRHAGHSGHTGHSGHGGHTAGRHARLLAAAVLEYIDIVRRWSSPPPDADAGSEEDEFEPAVTLMMGNLPSSVAVARDVRSRGGHWNPLARLDLTTRQAIQVAVAGALAIGGGYALSPGRYYWAAIAAFVAFTGTATRSETFVKAANRVIGTVLGLGVAIVLAHLTVGNTVATLAVILASMFCGLYLMRVSYAYMIFFITIVVAQLYSVLGRFSDQILVVRLEETAIGAAAGVLVALLVVPVSTRDTAATARTNFFTTLHDLLDGAASRVEDPAAGVDLDGLARTLDDRLRQLRQVLRPLTRPLLFGSGSPRDVRHRIVLYTACTTYARSLTSALRRTLRDPVAADRAQACRTLAAVAARFADEATASARGTSPADQLRDTIRSLAERGDPAEEKPGEPPAHPVDHDLFRLGQVLQQLTDQLEPTSVWTANPTAEDTIQHQ